MTRKLLSALALTTILATALVPADVVVEWGAKALETASRTVAFGPFMDNNG